MTWKELVRDPFLWALAAIIFGGGGFVGSRIPAPSSTQPAPVVGVSVERYNADRAGVVDRLDRIEDKLDRAIERGLVR